MYRGVDALVINKIDLRPYVKFDMDYFKHGVETLNPGVLTFPVSCQTGEGLVGLVRMAKDGAWIMSARAGLEIKVRGIVQGVGFRPFVYQLAQRFDLKGWVRNTTAGSISRSTVRRMPCRILCNPCE